MGLLSSSKYVNIVFWLRRVTMILLELHETTVNKIKERQDQSLPAQCFYLPAFPARPSQQRLGDKSVSLQNRRTMGWLASLMSYK